MQIELPNEIVANIEKPDLLLDIAIGLYTGRHVSMGQAASIAGMNRPQFQLELGKRKICVNFDMEDLEHDFKVAKELLG